MQEKYRSNRHHEVDFPTPHFSANSPLKILVSVKVVKAKNQKSQGRRARDTRVRGRLDVRGSRPPFARHNKHGSGYLDKWDIRRNREVVPIVLDSRQNDNENIHFCNTDIAISITSKEKTALFC